MDSSYLLTVSLGPVQDFIQVARKGRDLWFGSWLLSELSKAAAGAAVKQEGLDALIFPAIDHADQLQPNTLLNVSNKLLILVRETPPAELAEAMEDAAQARLMDIANATFDDVERGLVKDNRAHAGWFKRRSAQEQVQDLLEFYWAAQQWDGSNGPPYRAARAAAEALLAAAKNTRAFAQPTWAGNVPKSSLDGTRESVIHEDFYNALRNRLEHRRRLVGVNGAERLSGVDLLKRLGHRAAPENSPGRRVDSTSHFALATTLSRLEHSDRASEHFAQYREVLEELHAFEATSHTSLPVIGRLDGHMLFPNRLHELIDDEQLEHAQKALQHFWKALSNDAQRKIEPTPYYAIILADGDRVGKAINAVGSPEAHRTFGATLSAFAASVPPLLSDDQRGAQVVYAGGDDVLALVPIWRMLDTMWALQERFNEAMAPLDLPPGVVRPTMSMGVAIGHHLTPLQEVLDAARSAEKYAKDGIGRDAWAIAMHKRSGAPLRVGGRWEAFDTFRAHVGDFAQGYLPSRLPYDLIRAFHQLSTRSSGAQVSERVRRAQAIAILRQKIPSGLGREDYQNAADRVRDALNDDTLDAVARRLVAARTLNELGGAP